MSAQKRETFDEVAELYDQVRPDYPAQLFDDLVSLSGLPESGRVLEVGAGTGISTLPLAERGYRVVAVELGDDLAAVARKKLSRFRDVDVVVANFEDWELPTEPFDVVTSATAWHWIDPELRYKKAAHSIPLCRVPDMSSYRQTAGGDPAVSLPANYW